MTEVIKKVKGFVNKKGDKFELEPTAHTHDRIQNEDLCAEVECGTVGSTDVGKIKLYVENSEGEGQTAEITASNIGNLKRALQAPDSIPIANSNNPVTSGGVKAALDGKADQVHTHSAIGDEGSSITVGDGEINIELADPVTHSGGELNITVSKLPNLQRAINNPDSTPIADSNNLVTSGGVKAALAHLPVINDYLLDNGQYQSLGVDIDKAYDAVVKFPASDQCDILVRAVVTGDERPDSSQLSATVELVWGSNLYSFQRESLSQLRSLIRTAVLATGVTASAYDDATFGAKYFQLFYKVVIDSTSSHSGGYLEFELYDA